MHTPIAIVRLTLILVGATLILSCSGPCCTPPPGVPVAQAGTPLTEAPAPSAGIPDTRIGLDQHAITDTPTPHAFAYDDDTPTRGKTLARPYAGMPPQIPHDIADMLPITREENACLACHDPSNAEREADDGKPIPASHFIDFRNAPGKKGTHLAGARFNCTACHVPVTNARPLVGNRFRR